MAALDGTTLFVGNLSWETDDAGLSEYLRTAGNVVSCEIQRHLDTGRSKGWALCQFSTAAEAGYAISKFDQQVSDRFRKC